MAISPINITRVSHNMRTNFVADSLRRTQIDLFASQARIATGRRFVSAAEDPVAASRVMDFTRAISQQDQFVSNLYHGDNFLSAADSALTEIADLTTQGSVIANRTVSNLTSADERRAEAELVVALRQQLQAVGNRQFNGRYLFAGRNTTDRPFVDVAGGLAYVGDTGEMYTWASEGLAASVNLPGHLVFGALSEPITSNVDLTPRLPSTARLDDITAADGGEIKRGTLVFNEIGGAGVFTVDLSEADTIGDVIDRINSAAAEAGAGVTAALGDNGLVITPGGASVAISDASAGAIARDFGILTGGATSGTVTGEALRARVARLTPIADLAGGAGINLEGGLTVSLGVQSTTIDLSSAETVQDILNTINNAGLSVLARINDEGTGIDVFNKVSGASLSIGENGGTTATDLGIRTFNPDTPLNLLNHERGVSVVDGLDDLRITASDGSTVDVNLDGALTAGDVIDLINQAAQTAGVTITASFAQTGNGILVSDGTGGGGAMSVGSLNLSTAAMDLGLAQIASAGATEIIGDDVNTSRTEGILDVLMDLERALRADDTQAISAAGGRLDELRSGGTRMHGVIGARSQAMKMKLFEMEQAIATTKTFLSEVQDLDYAEAVSKMQAAMTQMQASLQVSSSLMNLSLMNYLR